MTSVSHKSRRAGLTLIELIAVLAILIALAGLLLPRLNDYLGAAHGASSATNISEAMKFTETFKARKSRYPNAWDGLVQTGGTSTVYVRLPIAGQSYIGVGPYTAGEVASLASSGVTQVWEHLATVPTGTSATEGYAAAAPVTIGTSAGRVTLTAAKVSDALGFQVVNKANAKFGFTTNPGDHTTFVVYGLGSGNELIGDTMADAPLHYDDKNGDPTATYQRFLAVFAVDNTGAEAAYLVGFIGPDGESIRDHLKDFSK
jgi:type II secretory pathway pseudopilin PulG